MKNKTILVTGGAGFIGVNICLEAKKRGYSVVAFDSFVRPKSDENIPILKKAGVEICRGDVRFMHDFHRSPVPDYIINLAGNPGIPWSIRWPTYDFEVNARGALNCLEYSRVMSDQVNHKIPVIQASTNKVYSDMINRIPLQEGDTRYEYASDFTSMVGVGNKGINEDFPIDCQSKYHHSPYGASKLAADQYMQEYYHQYGVPTVINRMSCVYGLYQFGVQDQGWVSHFVRMAVLGNREGKRKLNIFGDGKQVRDMLWGGDVARLYLDEIENIDKCAGQVFNIGGGVNNTMSLIEAIAVIEELTNVKFEIEHFDWRPADQKVYISDISKVKQVLGWEPTVLPQEGIQKMYVEYIS